MVFQKVKNTYWSSIKRKELSKSSLNATTVNLPLVHENSRAELQENNLISIQQTDSKHTSATIQGGKRWSKYRKRPDSQADT
jgi:hypothetical protein